MREVTAATFHICNREMSHVREREERNEVLTTIVEVRRVSVSLILFVHFI